MNVGVRVRRSRRLHWKDAIREKCIAGVAPRCVAAKYVSRDRGCRTVWQANDLKLCTGPVPTEWLLIPNDIQVQPRFREAHLSRWLQRSVRPHRQFLMRTSCFVSMSTRCSRTNAAIAARSFGSIAFLSLTCVTVHPAGGIRRKVNSLPGLTMAIETMVPR